jgi:uncharacterized protein YjdB
MTIETKELKISNELKRKVEMICKFAYVEYSITNGNVKSIKNTNIAYVKPHIVRINNINYLLFDNSDYIFINGYDKKIEFKDFDKQNMDIFIKPEVFFSNIYGWLNLLKEEKQRIISTYIDNLVVEKKDDKTIIKETNFRSSFIIDFRSSFIIDLINYNKEYGLPLNINLFQDEYGLPISTNKEIKTSIDAQKYFNKLVEVLGNDYKLNYYLTEPDQDFRNIVFKSNIDIEKIFRIILINDNKKYKNNKLKIGIITLDLSDIKAGYKFVTWEDKNGTSIYNEALLSESMTLYAVWEKESSSSSSSKESKPSSSTTLIEPTGVELNTTNKTMVVNTTDKLVATVKPDNAKDKTVTWSSNNPNVITVDKNGNIKAVGLGEATIKVKTSNDKIATAKVTSNVKSITLNVTNNTISKYGTITSTTINVNIDSNGYNVPNSLITWFAPDTTGYSAPAGMSTNGKTATLTARDVWGSTVSSIPVTVKINNKEAKTTIYVEPKISISNRSNGITCNERDERLYCTFKGEKSLHLQSNIDVTWEYYQNSPIIADIEGKDNRNLKLSVQYVSQNGLNIKAKSKAGQVKEIVLTPTV